MKMLKRPHAVGASPARIRRGALAALTALALAVGLFVAGTAPSSAASGGATAEADTWNLIWSDEFHGHSVDSSKWNIEDAKSPRNHELQYYAPKNVSVAANNLVITSKKENYNGESYTSGAVDTHGKFSFTYGKIVFRAKLPQMGKGVWPALWMLGTACNPVVAGTCPWPATGANEADVLEAVNDPTVIHSNAHWGPTKGTTLSPGSCSTSKTDYSAGYHLYALDWEPGVLTWSIDGVQSCQFKVAGYFQGPMFLIMNTAIGGSWPGNPDETTTFPQYFKVDYVRIYQKR